MAAIAQPGHQYENISDQQIGKTYPTPDESFPIQPENQPLQQSGYLARQVAAMRRRAINILPAIGISNSFDKHAKAAALLRDLSDRQRQFIYSHKQVIKNLLDGTVPLSNTRKPYFELANASGLSYSDFLDLVAYVGKYSSLKNYLFSSDYNQNQLVMAVNGLKR